eukprot:TRINITY_DN14913_c0_g1_i1.p1 TRINITY_DN14913_c0_g1~~TRINITY_DN14913_c0_g1_i1.p1  ORF type:complete len:743 (+),score=254.87 TRINITY_DN14913_c0_g1_i1:55-2283(+)
MSVPPLPADRYKYRSNNRNTIEAVTGIQSATASFKDVDKDSLRKSVDLSNGSNTKSSRSASTSVPNKNKALSMGFKLATRVAKEIKAQTQEEIQNPYPQWNLDPYPTAAVTIFETLMKAVGVGSVPMGANEEDFVGTFMVTFVDKLAEKFEKNPRLSDQNLQLLQSVSEKCKTLIQNQHTLQKIIKVQSLQRGRSIRKKLQIWTTPSSAEDTLSPTPNARLKKYAQALSELTRHENDYVKSLKVITENYMRPLKNVIEDKRKSLLPGMFLAATLSKEDVNDIFGNVELLLRVHQKMKAKFRTIETHFPFANVGEIFLFMAPELVVYGQYVANCTNALNTLARVQQEDPKFKEFLESVVSTQSVEPLMGLLLKPLNHIPQYRIFLKAMINNSPKNNPDLANLHNAYMSIKKTCKYIEEANIRSISRAKILDLQRKLTLPPGIQLEVPKREFLGEGHVISVEKLLAFSTSKERVYFLFNDLFILAEEIAKDKYRSTNMVSLKDSSVENSSEENQLILNHGKDKLVLQLRNSSEKNSLFRKLRENIEAVNMSKRTFGVPLTKLLEREKPANGIPFLVSTTINYIKQNKEAEGIFRISGGSEEVGSLRTQFDALTEVPKQPLNLAGKSPHAVAGILKMFFRELPEPLLTFDLYTTITTSNLDIPTMKAILKNIPESNRVLLKYLAIFLTQVAASESKNKMGLANLATVFGPNLLYPREETLEAILCIPKVNAAIQFILQHHEQVFD